MGGATGKVSSALETYGDRPISNGIVKIKKVLERIQISWETPEGQNRAKKTILIKVIVNREYLSYIVAKDYGFAPNPSMARVP